MASRCAELSNRLGVVASFFDDHLYFYNPELREQPKILELTTEETYRLWKFMRESWDETSWEGM